MEIIISSYGIRGEVQKLVTIEPKDSLPLEVVTYAFPNVLHTY